MKSLIKRLLNKLLNKTPAIPFDEWDHWEQQHGALVCRSDGETWELRKAQIEKGRNLTFTECKEILKKHRDRQFHR